MQATHPVSIALPGPFENYQTRVLFIKLPTQITEKSVNTFLDTLQPPDHVLTQWLEAGLLPMWSALSELAFDWERDHETDYESIARELIPQVLEEARELAQVYQ